MIDAFIGTLLRTKVLCFCFLSARMPFPTNYRNVGEVLLSMYVFSIYHVNITDVKVFHHCLDPETWLIDSHRRICYNL